MYKDLEALPLVGFCFGAFGQFCRIVLGNPQQSQVVLFVATKLSSTCFSSHFSLSAFFTCAFFTSLVECDVLCSSQKRSATWMRKGIDNKRARATQCWQCKEGTLLYHGCTTRRKNDNYFTFLRHFLLGSHPFPLVSLPLTYTCSTPTEMVTPSSLANGEHCAGCLQHTMQQLALHFVCC